MATVDGDSAAILASGSATPIAQLNPDLPDQASRVVRGDVTITWPYNSVTNKLAFLLAEPDVRLRRAKGQIRIELQGPSAKAAFESGLGAGDELLFSLAGAEWSKDASPGRIPGARVEWQLQFNQKLVLQVKFGESGETKHINIDHPTAEQPDGPVTEVPRATTPEPEPSIPEIPATARKISEFTANEYPSPAFVKRARLSYGALFEGGFDLFEEDGGVKGKGRKRTRFGRDSSAWRYSSQSPSPEPTSPAPDAMDEDSPEPATPQLLPKPQTMDEGCQTVDFEMALAAPEPFDTPAPRREKTPIPPETPVPIPRGAPAAPTPERTTTHQAELLSSPPIPVEEPAALVQKQQVSTPREELGSVTDSTPAGEPHGQSPRPPVENEQAQEQPPTTVPQPTLLSASNTETSPSTLFGPKSFGASFSSFGAGAPAPIESSLSLADQVRFGFSHVPQTTLSPSPPKPGPIPEPDHHQQHPYPMAYLDDAPTPAKYADMDTYLNVADEQDEMAVHDQAMPPEPPTVEQFGDGQWEMSAQSPHYNLVEGGHFGTDALDEGARVMAEQPSLHADNMAPDKVPEGFASYGHEYVPDRHQESPARQEHPHEDQPLVENEDTISGDEVGVDEEEDEDEKLDEYAYGERLEEGDYDQRNYDIVSDDDEGLSEEDEEAELEAEERYGNGELYDEDGEGEEWDEEDEEEDYESDEEGDEEGDEEDYDMSAYQPRRPVAPPPTGEPVVISLLSDSEDEDEPAPPPRKPAPAAREAPAPEPRASSEATPSPRRQESPAVLETVETDSTETEQTPNMIFGQTHVVDFAMRGNYVANQQLSAPPAGVGADTESSSFTSQVPGSFGVSGARHESYVPESKPAPTEGSSDLLFVSQSKPQPAPSESSSEGLFISQPRARSPYPEDDRTDAGSTNETEGADEGSTDDGTELELEQARDRDEGSSVEEIERDETASPPPEPQNNDASLPDADGLSFSSQVEMPEEFGESEDEHMSVDEDAPPRAAVAVDAVVSTLEVEEVTVSEDVDMIDAASPQVESTFPEKMDSSPPEGDQVETSAVASDVVVTEVTSEVVDITAADGPLPGTQISAQQGQQIPSPTVSGLGLAAAELPQEMAENLPNGQHNISGAKAESPDEPTISTSTASLKSQADLVAQEVPESAQESQPPVEAAVMPPTESQRETDETLVMNDKAINGTDGVGPPDVEAAAESQEDGVILDASIPPQPLTVASLDGTVEEAQPVIPLFQAEQDKQEQPVDGAEKSPVQAQEAEPARQPASPATDDLEDETMILEQLTQEQQQSFEAEAAESQARTRSSSPDLSVHLARQAVAAKRNKKAPEPTRTSTRITRARSSSLRSNITNGTPEKEREEDTSVSLARAALASPSKGRAAEVDGTPEKEEEEEDTSISLARAALASPSKGHSAEVDGTSTSTAITSPNTAASLKADLTKRLRTDLPECVPIKSLRNHLDKFPNVVAVVTSEPTQPTRAKGGPREYFMSFHVTDPSAAPNMVVEVQMYRPHKDSLPVVRPGDAVLLQRFQVKPFSKKGFGLRTGVESAWAVWEGRRGDVDVGDNGQTAPPQIRGPPVEDWKGYAGYVGLLRQWFALVMADEAAKGKLERAGRKLVEGK